MQVAQKNNHPSVVLKESFSLLTETWRNKFNNSQELVDSIELQILSVDLFMSGIGYLKITPSDSKKPYFYHEETKDFLSYDHAVSFHNAKALIFISKKVSCKAIFQLGFSNASINHDSKKPNSIKVIEFSYKQYEAASSYRLINTVDLKWNKTKKEFVSQKKQVSFKK